MTTLPQTTTTRLPSIGGGAGLPAAYTAVPTAIPGVGMTGADVWRVVRGSLWLVILFAVAFGVGGYFLNRELMKRFPDYKASGLVRIKTQMLIKPIDGTMSEMSQLSLQSVQRTQASLLMADGLLSEVLKREDLRKTSWAKQFTKPDGTFDAKEAREYLRKNVNVSAVPESELINVTARYKVPADAKAIVVELVNAHLEEQRRQAENNMRIQTQALRDLQTYVNARLVQVSNTARDKMMNLAEKGSNTGGFFSPLEIRLRSLVEAHIELKADATKAKQAWATIGAQLERGETPSIIEKAIENDASVNSLARDVSVLTIQRDQLIDEKGPENPAVHRVNRHIELTQKQLDKRRAELRVKYRDQLVESLKGDANDKSTALVEVEKNLAELMTLLSDLGREQAAFLVLQEEEKGLRAQKTEIDNRLRDITAISSPENQSKIGWASMPEVPEFPTFPQLKVILPLSVLLGIGLALGIAFLREYLDDTVRSPRDVARVQMSMLGMISDESDDPQLSDAQLAIFDAPNSLTAEQFRQMRTRLQHAASLDTCRSIMITGPNPESGKTTVAANLAAGLALNGRKILLVDSNFRRPDLHRFFGTNNERGFSDVLTGHAVLEDTVFHTRVPNLTILPAGAKLVNATELFESQLLIDFIERALEDYDHVIFDSGPLLIVSEAVAMAPRVDGVITVVRAHSESRGLLQRMRDELRKIKAENLGVVLNAVRARGGGYYGRLARTYYDYQSAA
jgi:polysaccharide biosynthesis transport protein